MTRKRTPGGDYPIGYGKPPVEHRWQKGQSGNSRGRSKGTKTVAEILKAKLQARVFVGDAGKRRSMTMQELIIEKLVRDAAKGEQRARATLLGLMARYEASDAIVMDPSVLSSEDQNLIDAYLTRSAASPAGVTGAPEKATQDTTDRDGAANEEETS